MYGMRIGVHIYMCEDANRLVQLAVRCRWIGNVDDQLLYEMVERVACFSVLYRERQASVCIWRRYVQLTVWLGCSVVAVERHQGNYE